MTDQSITTPLQHPTTSIQVRIPSSTSRIEVKASSLTTPCINCNAAHSSLWVKSPEHPGHRVCNACYLYRRKHGTHRNGNIVRRGIKTDGVNVISGRYSVFATANEPRSPPPPPLENLNLPPFPLTKEPIAAAAIQKESPHNSMVQSNSEFCAQNITEDVPTTTVQDLTNIPHCSNCLTTTTSRPWFKSRTVIGDLVCNACWQYEIKHGKPRSKFVVRRGRPISKESKKAQGMRDLIILKKKKNKKVEEEIQQERKELTFIDNQTGLPLNHLTSSNIMMHTLYKPTIMNEKNKQKRVLKKIRSVILEMIKKYSKESVVLDELSDLELMKFIKNVDLVENSDGYVPMFKTD